MIGRTLSHYEILEKIGAGGMGDVYRARDARLERDVAVKFLRSARLDDEAARNIFRREALSLSKLNHPNVQTVFDFDSDDEVDFLVTEYVPGITLSAKITPEGMPEKEVLELGEQLAAGLAAAHAEGIVHRDLKPGNLRVMPDGRLKILDFGLAKLIGPAHESATTLSRFETQTLAGTPHYMAPEQRAGRPADARSDIYSAGLVLREMIVGEPEPREGTPLRASPGLKRIIQKCLESEPEKRYPSANDLLEKIRRLQRPRALRRTVGALTGAVVVLAALLVGRPDRANVGIDSVVALPSEVLGSGAEDYLADAVPKTISTYLAQVEGLETKLPPAGIEVARFEGDLDRIADTYGVNALVLSTVTAHSEGLVLNVQLVEAEGRRLIWSGDYEAEKSEYLGLVQEAAEELRQQLRPGEAAIVASRSVALSSQAELVFQRGLYYSNRFNNLHHVEDFDASFAAFEEALALDPTFGDAAAEIAWLYEFKLEAGLDPREAIPQMDAWARRTLEIDDENGRAWAVLTTLEAGQGKEGPSLTLSGLRAVRFAPRFPRSHIALGLALPSCRLSLQAYRESAQVDPLYLYAPAMSASMLLCMGRPDDALVENEQALAIVPDFGLGLLMKAGYLHGLGRLDMASSLLERLEPFVRDGHLHPAWLGQGREVNTVLRNEPGETEVAFDRLRQTASGQNRFPYWQGFTNQAIDILGMQGRIDEARELLVHLDAAGITSPYDRLMLSPHKAWVRDDPTLQRIIAKSRRRFEETTAILEDARGRSELPVYLEDPLDELLIELDMN